jgi:phasin family protein
MYQAPEQLMAWNKSSLEAATRLAGITLEGAERLLEIQLKTAKSMFADSVLQTKTLSQVQGPQEFAQLKDTLLQPNLEKTTAYLKSIYDAASATQAEFGKVLETQVAEFNRHVVTGLDTIAKSSPPGSEVAVAAVKSAISAVNSSYENLSKSARQFAEMAQANVETVASQKPGAGKKKTA